MKTSKGKASLKIRLNIIPKSVGDQKWAYLGIYSRLSQRSFGIKMWNRQRFDINITIITVKTTFNTKGRWWNSALKYIVKS